MIGGRFSRKGSPNQRKMDPTQAEARNPYIDPFKLEDMTPDTATAEQRIEMTTKCRDMDTVRRVSRAGQVQTLPDKTRVQIMHNGLRVLADGYYGEWMTRLIESCRGCHEPQEERVFYEVMKRLRAEATMIELGGFWAFYSLWFLSGGRRRRSIVLEPDPKHLAVGEVNAHLNGLTATFIQGCLGGAATPPTPFKTEESGEILVPRFTVPLLMQIHGIDRLDILHCDTQGAELDMLRSCEEMFDRRRIQFLFVSTHDFRVTGDPLTHQRCLAVILNCGGQIIAEHDVQESYSGDGLIVAYFGDDRRAGERIPVSRNRCSESMFRNPLYDLSVVRGSLAQECGRLTEIIKEQDEYITELKCKVNNLTK
jgi:FkbM family methyltransferase